MSSKGSLFSVPDTLDTDSPLAPSPLLPQDFQALLAPIHHARLTQGGFSPVIAQKAILALF